MLVNVRADYLTKKQISMLQATQENINSTNLYDPNTTVGMPSAYPVVKPNLDNKYAQLYGV